MKITAEEARNISGPSIQEQVNLVYPLIRAAAEAKRRFVNLHDSFWVNGGYAKSAEWIEAVALLEKDGFKVRFFYQERQFVDMYTVVEW